MSPNRFRRASRSASRPLSPQPATITIEDYAETFLERIEQTRKHTTHADYRKILDHDILPVFRGQALAGHHTREE